MILGSWRLMEDTCPLVWFFSPKNSKQNPDKIYNTTLLKKGSILSSIIFFNNMMWIKDTISVPYLNQRTVYESIE